MPASTLLSDIRVVDLTTILFGPYCTQTLADMGAEVIKIETETGDDFRNVGRSARTRKMGPCHLTVNRGKRSVVWDLKSDTGQKAIRRLLESADIFIHNIRDDAIARLGLTFDQVRQIKPDIVYVHCVGFGSNGPYAGRPAYDDLIQGLSGMASLLPRVDGNEQPRFMPMAMADKVSGLHAVYAALAALRHRDKSAEPVHVEVPMFECVTHFLLEEHFSEAAFDPPTGPFCYQRQIDPARQPLQTANGWLVLAPYTDNRWVRVFDVFDAPHELDDARLSDRQGRFRNMAYMIERARTYVVRQSTEHWLEVFGAADVPAARVNDISELQGDPHLAATGFFQRREHPTEGAYWETQPPVRFHNIETREISPARHLGEDTERVSAEL